MGLFRYKNSVLRSTLLSLLCISSSVFALPDYPAIDNDKKIRVFDRNNNFVAPFLPGHRSTADGRVMVPMITNNKFFLNVPEKIDKPFVTSSPGTGILASVNGVAQGLPFNEQDIIGHPLRPGGEVGMRAICDATSEFAGVNVTTPSPEYYGTRANPVDLYRFMVIVPYGEKFAADNRTHIEIWGRWVNVEVSNPKTPQAQLQSFSWEGNPVKGIEYDVYNHKESNLPFAEPVMTNDGRFLIFRTGGATLTWRDENKGRNFTNQLNMLYSVAPATARPCDLAAFSPLRPISHAPFDNDVKTRYGFAESQFRDPEGNLIPDGADFPATYPWIDRDGANIMFETLNTTLHYEQNGQVKTRYPARCGDGTTTSCNLNPSVSELDKNGPVEWKGSKRGVAIAGRWTRGKIVLFDGLVNNTDYALGYDRAVQREIKLYEANSGPAATESGWVSAGFGQESTIAYSIYSPRGMDMNANLIDSMENLFSYRKSFTPVSFRDVTWLVTSGRTTAEVEFDDYIDANAYIVSTMNASQSYTGRSTMTYRDGFLVTSTGAGFTGPKRVQNAATTTNFRIPAYGQIVGDARIEPIAMGGVEGRGLFLQGNGRDGIEYAIPAADLADKSWTISMFVDPRFQDDGAIRRLFTFPDSTTVELVGLSKVRVSKSGYSRDFNVPGGTLKTKAWSQVGFFVNNGGAGLYVDGFRVGYWKPSDPSVRLFEMVGAKLTVGVGAFRGWIDDFKVLAHGGSTEFMCNLAKGTLIGLNGGYNGQWRDIADAYGEPQHEFMRRQVPADSQFSRYACFHDYSGRNLAHSLSIPADTVRVGQKIHFPEGPLAFNSPRPDSSSNNFCLMCHDSGNSSSELGLSALSYQGSTNMENDSRRQPMQAPRAVYGHIPRDFVGPGLPSLDLDTTRDGFLLLDSLLH